MRRIAAQTVLGSVTVFYDLGSPNAYQQLVRSHEMLNAPERLSCSPWSGITGRIEVS